MTTSLETIKQLMIDMHRQFDAAGGGGLEDSRRRFDENGLSTPLPAGIHIEPVIINANLSADWIIPANADGEKIILYFHGGGYSAGSSLSHRPLCGRIAHHSGCRILSVNYRRSPEYKYPAALEDALTSYAWLQQSCPASHIVMMGDSAGGGLTMASLLAIKQNNLSMPGGAVGISAWLDLECSSASYETNKEIDLMASAGGLRFVGRAYASKSINRDPLVSPFYSDNLKGLCPLLMQIGSAETLLDENIHFAEQAKKDGVQVELQIWPNMVHVWPSLYNVVPEAKIAIEAIGAWIRALP
jgi:monoterpene epsilon-lactone hydrolase